MLKFSWLQVDKGFVAQVAAVVGGRKAPMNEEQEQQAEKSIVGEFSTVKHVRGILSMGRYLLCEVLAEICLIKPSYSGLNNTIVWFPQF
jgi:hypothetical protein